MPDINNPEIKKNDIQGKGITTSTGGVSMASISTPIPTVKINTPQSEVKYPVEDLIKNSKALTGYGKEVAVGALFNCKEKELTKSDFKKLIDTFLKRKVK